VNHWQGRLALKVEGPAAQAWTAFFELDGNPERGSLVLSSLFGTRLARMQWSPGSASLQTPSENLQFPSLEAMAAHHTSSPIPVAALFSWLQGQRADVKGWEVSMDQLPQGRLSALQRGPDNALTELKVILDR
jgi:outer membrane lipoprotein LolB